MQSRVTVLRERLGKTAQGPKSLERFVEGGWGTSVELEKKPSKGAGVIPERVMALASSASHISTLPSSRVPGEVQLMTPVPGYLFESGSCYAVQADLKLTA